ncbi:MAG TPA: TonB-dependent receptor [Steroidobacteraceae bacterium]|nr:TonB-dependent receptor [Steroidobacteraceae bacterium]
MKTYPDSATAVGACSLLLALQLAGTAAVRAADSAAADPTPAANAQAANASSTSSSEELNEVIVTGIRADLEKALNTKEFAPVVLDSIDSTELGRFPDSDVADSLEHLPGITVSRTTGGEGQKITVQGLGSQYNIVTMDNRILASDDSGRDIAFDVLPAELISGADVLKSPQASAVEGSIGGTVNLHTASAFEHPGFHADAHAEGNWNDMSHLTSKKFSAFITDTNAARTLGFVLGAVDTNLKSRTDSLNAYNQNIYGPISYPYPPDGVTPPPGSTPLIATPCCITFGSIFDTKKRYGLMGNVEWRPNDSFRLKADALWTHLNDPQQGYNESYYFAANPDGTPFENNPGIQNGVITSMVVDNFQPEMVNNTINRKVDTFLYGLNAQWKPTDSLTFGADVYRSTASRPEGGQDTFVTAGLVNDQPTAEDILNFADEPNSLPNINVVVPPSQIGLSACPAGTDSTTNAGYCSYTALMNSRYLNNNKYWSTHYVGLNGFSVHDKITGFTLSGAWQADMGILEQVTFGVGGTHRDKEQVDSDNDWTNGSGQYGTLYQTYGCPVQCSPYSFGSQGFNVVSLMSLPNFMEGAGGSYPMVLPQLNAGQLLAFLKSLDGKPNPFYCTTQPCTGPYTPFDFSQTLPQVNAFNSYAVTEKTISGYLEAGFGGSRWSGNLGLRMVHTTTTANTASAVPVSLWTPSNTASSTQTWNVQYGTSQALGGNGSYTLALPSLNLAYWVVRNQLQARLALAQTMARPDLSQLAPTSNNNAENGTPQLSYNGTAGLKPIRANQVDLSLEWYYSAHSALTADVFAKRVKDDIYDAVSTNVDLGTLQYIGGPPGTVPGKPFLWTITAPANGAESTYSGVELTWQEILADGFGTRMQFTATRTRSYDQYGNFVGAINAAPPTTWTIGLFYDKGPISADVNWDHQSGFTSACSECTDVPGWPALTRPFNWVTASLHYHVTHGLEVYWEGKNLSNSIVRTYLNGNPLLPWAPGQNTGGSESGVGSGYTAFGRTYVLGVAWRY